MGTYGKDTGWMHNSRLSSAVPLPGQDQQIWLAQVIATTAHGACNQRRADGVTPYIAHPARVAQIVTQYGGGWDEIAAAWLHDVVEDTALDIPDLAALGVSEDVLALVYLLTKADPALGTDLSYYYTALSTNPKALRVKYADSYSNVQDATEQVLQGRHLSRWREYLIKTRNNLLPLYEHDQMLSRSLSQCLYRLEEALVNGDYSHGL